MQSIVIALGSNLGKRERNLEKAVELILEGNLITLNAKSAIYETAPVGGPEQGPYLNACIKVETNLSPTILMLRLLAIEDRMGRIRKEYWGPRTIDLDMLLYDQIIMNTPLLQLPHPRLAERDFVLIPLADIAPGLIIPGYNKNVSQLLEKRTPAADIKFHSNL